MCRPVPRGDTFANAGLQVLEALIRSAQYTQGGT